MKRFWFKGITAVLLTALLVTLLPGCDQKAEQTDPTQEETQPAHVHTQALCPWEYNVCEQAAKDGKLHYYFMAGDGLPEDEADQGWGDCCLVVFPGGGTMLIDTGSAEYGPVLVENLTRMGVEKLDYLVITNASAEHRDGAFHESNLTGEGLLDKITVGQVCYAGGTDPQKASSDPVEAVCAQRQLPLTVLEQGTQLQTGEVTTLVLWPAAGTAETVLSGVSDIKNHSIVLRFELVGHSALFMGDLYEMGEMELLRVMEREELDATMLKLANHGSSGSNCSYLLDTVTAELAVATGYQPIEQALTDRIANYSTQLLCDYDHGYIHVSTDGAETAYETSRGIETDAQ